jgi:pilus assembly protein Flp/PilA
VESTAQVEDFQGGLRLPTADRPERFQRVAAASWKSGAEAAWSTVEGEKHGDAIDSTKDHTMLPSITRFLKSEDGPTAVEYAVMLALIIVVCLTAVRAVGTNASNKFNQVKNQLT